MWFINPVDQYFQIIRLRDTLILQEQNKRNSQVTTSHLHVFWYKIRSPNPLRSLFTLCNQGWTWRWWLGQSLRRLSKTEPVFAGKSCRRSLPNNGGGKGDVLIPRTVYVFIVQVLDMVFLVWQKFILTFDFVFKKKYTGWWFQIFFMITPNLGEDSHFDKYFSDGLEPPTSISYVLLSRFCELSYDLICAGRDMNVFFSLGNDARHEKQVGMEVIGTSERLTSQSFCLDYEESLEQFGSPWISRGKEFTSKTECVALPVCHVEFFWRYGWIIPIVHIIVHRHHPMCAWSNCWNSWTLMNFSSLGMGIRITMFAEIFFGVKQLVLKNYGQNSPHLLANFPPFRRPRWFVGMWRGECNRRFVHSRCLN